MNTTYKKNYIANAAGVTFPNEDGIHRQFLLANELGEREYKAVIITAQKTKYNEEDAVKLILNKQQIGWLPKTLAAGWTDEKLTGVIKYFKKENTYYMELYKYEAPTQKQYYYIKTMGIKLPYIKEEYAKTITEIKLKESENEKTIEDFLK